MSDSESLDTLKRNSVIATSSNSTHIKESLFRITLVVGVVLFAFQLFGQEESPDESETTEASESITEENTEETQEVGTSEDSEPSNEDLSTDTSEQADTSASSVEDTSTEEETNSDDTTRTEETAEESDSEDDIFVPTEKLSEDIPIPFPVDIWR